MRRTLFVLPLDLVPAAQAAASVAVAAEARRMLIRHLGEAGIDDPERFVDSAVDATEDALQRVGEATTAELADVVPALKVEVDPSPGKAYGGLGRISNRVVTLLAARGRAVRTRPVGGLTSSLVRWAPVTTLFPDGIPEMSTADGTRVLVDRWLRASGPGTTDDISWWLGGSKRAASAALEAVAAEAVALAEWLGDVRVAPRMPTPLQRAIAAGP